MSDWADIRDAKALAERLELEGRTEDAYTVDAIAASLEAAREQLQRVYGGKQFRQHRLAMARHHSDGMRVRRDGLGREACPFGLDEAESRSWWLAGWHDADQEMTAREAQA